MSNTATTAMMIPVGLGVLAASGVTGAGKRSPVATGFLLTIAYAASIGGILTPVGSPPNLITLGLLDRLAGVRINFLVWMLMVLPLGIVLSIAMFGLGTLLFGRVGPARGSNVAAAIPDEPSGTWTRGQLNCLIAFGCAVVLWVTPGVMGLMGWSATPFGQALTRRLDEGAVAITAACLLFVLPVDWRSRRFTLSWQQAARIDWGTILLFGAGLSLGRLMFETGLAERVGMGLIAVSGADSLWSVTAMSIALGIIVTEITSNTAATNMLVPVILTICSVGGFHPVPPAMGACLGASMAFMMPISTPPNAIVYGTGMVPITAMIKFGILLDVTAFFIILAGLRLLCPLFGFV
jgi:sodium-dependent dicarboxylate transporter 2/3/5